MIEKKTVTDEITIRRNGSIEMRFGLLLVEDGREISCRWHRSGIEPGGDVDEQIAAVNADITTRDELKASPVGSESISQLKAICAVVHTPDVVSGYREEMKKRSAGAPDA